MAQEVSAKQDQPDTAVQDEDFIVDEATDEILRLHLDSFEGPFEVLLYLIRSQEIDIFDIPIATITEQYLRFLQLMEEQNLDVAGEYLVLAATLIQIKSKMLLPIDLDDEEEIEEGEDPRMELVEKLLAYRKFREVAARLSQLEAERADWYTRNVRPTFEQPNDEDDYVEVSLFDLLQAFKGVIRFLAPRGSHTIEMETVSVDEKIAEIESLLERNETVAWVDLFNRSPNRADLVCAFLAILEMCRMGAIRAHQHRIFGDIRLFAANRSDNP